MISVIIVSGSVISFSEKKVESAWKRAAEVHVAQEVDRYFELRKARIDGSARFLERIGNIKQIASIFETGDFGKDSINAARRELSKGHGPQSPGSPRGGGGGPPGPDREENVICLIDLNGKPHPVSGGAMKHDEHRNVFKVLRSLENFDTRQTGNLVFDFEDEGNKEKRLLEVIVVPVKNKAGDYAGALFLGQPYRNIQSPEKRSGGPPKLNLFNPDMLSAVYAEGGIFGDGDVIERNRYALQEMLANPAETDRLIRDGQNPYRVYAEELNPDSALPHSLQVVLYPMAPLYRELADLRMKGSGIGLVALLLGWIFAWWIARSFAKPIRELSAATREIRDGNFKTRVAVQSNDELGELSASFNDMAGELALKERLRETLGKVSDETVAQALIAGSLELGGENREVSILFCDVRGFTGITETMEPQELIAFINEHMTAMTRLVHEHKGVVDKFVGDEIMAVFGAPKSYGADATNAARCAVAMIAERERLNKTAEVPCDIGIGIATGEVVVGCMGSIDRLNYTVLGERVNRGARLCSLAKAGQVVVDETTCEQVGPEFHCNPLNDVMPKGYSEPMRAFEVISTSQKGESESQNPAEETVAAG